MRWLIGLCVLVATSSASAAPPTVIIFGGGWGPEGTQVSLEVQAIALQSALARTQPILLFGGPDSNEPIIQVKSDRTDRVGRLLGVIFERSDLIDVSYRRTRVRMTGPATKQEVLARLRRASRTNAPIAVFGLGHGSPVDEGSARLDLWGPAADALTVKELQKEIGYLKPRAPIGFVLGQCHSGAFTEIVIDRPAARTPICVLAAIPADREASGCTNDINDPSAKAFMTLVGRAFTKQRAADLDDDNRVSLGEAFTYARVHDKTIDVPVSSSETLLRFAMGKARPKIAGQSIDALIKAARPNERAVLKALRPDFAKRADARAGAVELRHNALLEQLDRLDKSIAADEKRRHDAQSRLRQRVMAKWPELGNPYHRVSRQLLANDARAIVNFAAGLPELATYLKWDGAVGKKLDRYETINRQAAQLERWLRAAENVVYERTLRASRDRVRLKAFERVLECEAMTP